jgi:hypothetical protein
MLLVRIGVESPYDQRSPHGKEPAPSPNAPSEIRLEPLYDQCRLCERKLCGSPTTASSRTVATLEGLVRLRLVVRRCVNRECELYHRPYRPEQEGAFALPQGEFGLDVIALVGALRHAEHRSVPEIHRELWARGVRVSERTVTNLLERYEELVALRLSDRMRLRERLVEQEGRLVLAIATGCSRMWATRFCGSCVSASRARCF